MCKIPKCGQNENWEYFPNELYVLYFSGICRLDLQPGTCSSGQFPHQNHWWRQEQEQLAALKVQHHLCLHHLHLEVVEVVEEEGLKHRSLGGPGVAYQIFRNTVL